MFTHNFVRFSSACFQFFSRSWIKHWDDDNKIFVSLRSHLWLRPLRIRALSNSHLVYIFYVNFVPLFSFLPLFYFSVIKTGKLEQNKCWGLLTRVRHHEQMLWPISLSVNIKQIVKFNSYTPKTMRALTLSITNLSARDCFSTNAFVNRFIMRNLLNHWRR